MCWNIKVTRFSLFYFANIHFSLKLYFENVNIYFWFETLTLQGFDCEMTVRVLVSVFRTIFVFYNSELVPLVWVKKV